MTIRVFLPARFDGELTVMRRVLASFTTAANTAVKTFAAALRLADCVVVTDARVTVPKIGAMGDGRSLIIEKHGCLLPLVRRVLSAR